MIHLKFYSLLLQISRRARRMYTALAVEGSTSTDVASEGGLSRERFISDQRVFSSASQTWRTEHARELLRRSESDNCSNYARALVSRVRRLVINRYTR